MSLDVELEMSKGWKFLPAEGQEVFFRDQYRLQLFSGCVIPRGEQVIEVSWRRIGNVNKGSTQTYFLTPKRISVPDIIIQSSPIHRVTAMRTYHGMEIRLNGLMYYLDYNVPQEV
jgi:hypothetical protein